MWAAGAFAPGGELTSVHGRLFDVSEFDRLKGRLLGARRMEAIGRLEAAALVGITHLIVASCTGFVAPGIDQIIAAELGLAPSSAIEQLVRRGLAASA